MKMRNNEETTNDVNGTHHALGEEGAASGRGNSPVRGRRYHTTFGPDGPGEPGRERGRDPVGTSGRIPAAAESENQTAQLNAIAPNLEEETENPQGTAGA
jgi:hypothetical protein